MGETNQLQDLEREYNELHKKHEALELEIKDWEKKCTPKYEMKLLHKYNELKDAAQILIGAIANIEGVTIKELHKRFELPVNDD